MTTRADLARYNTGVRRAVDTYVAERNGYVRCRRNHARKVGTACEPCHELGRTRNNKEDR